MGYSFMTIKKITGFSALNSSFKHNYRIYQPANADIEKADLNDELVPIKNGNTYSDAIKQKILELQENGTMKTVRKDAVLAYEVVTTFSREELEHIDVEKWKKDNVEWLNKTFNIPGSNTDNVISVMFHGDEPGNIHIHSIVVPINEKGRLCAKSFTGDRRFYRDMQDSYGKMMKQRHGLERGLKGSIAKHQDIKRLYTELNKALNPADMPKPEKDEDLDHYYQRAMTFVENNNLAHIQEKRRLERKIVEAQTENKQYVIENVALHKENVKRSKKLKSIFTTMTSYAIEHNLTPEEVEKMLKSYSALQSGLKNYHDKEFASQTAKDMNTIMHEERKRQKSIEKSAKEKWEL